MTVVTGGSKTLVNDTFVTMNSDPHFLHTNLLPTELPMLC